MAQHSNISITAFKGAIRTTGDSEIPVDESSLPGTLSLSDDEPEDEEQTQELEKEQASD